MAIDILNLQPSSINRALSGKSILLAGPPKIGKSEFCAQSPDTLILDFENGYTTHFGVKKVNINSWSDVKLICKQLERNDAQQLYKNVVFDTLNEAWDLCTNYICAQNGVQKINQLPYGQGYKDRDNEFAFVMRKILNLGYGLIVTCHTKETVVGQKEDIDILQITPDLDKRCVPIINGLVDIMGMITKTWNEETNSWDRWLLTKSTPNIEAGSRIKYLAPKIPFGYSYLEDAINKAFDEAVKNGAKIATDNEVKCDTQEKLDYNKIRSEAKDLWIDLVVNAEDEIKADEMARRIRKRIEIIFGHEMALSEITEDQVELFNLVLIEMRELAAAQ